MKATVGEVPPGFEEYPFAPGIPVEKLRGKYFETGKIPNEFD